MRRNAPVAEISDAEIYQRMLVDKGLGIIEKQVECLNLSHLTELLRKLEEYFLGNK